MSCLGVRRLVSLERRHNYRGHVAAFLRPGGGPYPPGSLAVGYCSRRCSVRRAQAKESEIERPNREVRRFTSGKFGGWVLPLVFQSKKRRACEFMLFLTGLADASELHSLEGGRVEAGDEPGAEAQAEGRRGGARGGRRGGGGGGGMELERIMVRAGARTWQRVKNESVIFSSPPPG